MADGGYSFVVDETDMETLRLKFRLLYLKFYLLILGSWRWLCKKVSRYHILDLRQPGEYNGGWIEPDQAILCACFGVLKKYVESESFGVPSEKEVTDSHDPEFMKNYRLKMMEIRDLYNYWTKSRLWLMREIKMTSDRAKRDELCSNFDLLEEAMLIKLIKIRGNMVE